MSTKNYTVVLVHNSAGKRPIGCTFGDDEVLGYIKRILKDFLGKNIFLLKSEAIFKKYQGWKTAIFACGRNTVLC